MGEACIFSSVSSKIKICLALNIKLIIVTYRLIVRQRLGKYISAEAYARNKTSVSRQGISKQAFSAMEAVFSAWSVPMGYKGTKKVV
jgi:hypothetical protein